MCYLLQSFSILSQLISASNKLYAYESGGRLSGFPWRQTSTTREYSTWGSQRYKSKYSTFVKRDRLRESQVCLIGIKVHLKNQGYRGSSENRNCSLVNGAHMGNLCYPLMLLSMEKPGVSLYHCNKTFPGLGHFLGFSRSWLSLNSSLFSLSFSFPSSVESHTSLLGALFICPGCIPWERIGIQIWVSTGRSPCVFLWHWWRRKLQGNQATMKTQSDVLVPAQELPVDTNVTGETGVSFWFLATPRKEFTNKFERKFMDVCVKRKTTG